MMSGDWIPLSLPDKVKAAHPRARVVGLGGATEASNWSILHTIEAVDPNWSSIPYGKPMANQTVHVLNDRMEPGPIWAPRQLYIGCIGVAKGYWRDEEKTRAGFIRHPETRERLCKIGDLDRYLPDGNIEFLGREDFQVKIRGHRIEPGKIETALRQHPSTREAAASAVGESRENRHLIAYIVPARPLADDSDKGTFDQYLREKLPSYMIPTRYIRLERLPLIPNGKVDRAALPEPGSLPDLSEAEPTPPSTPVEELIVQTWTNVLKTKRIGVNDNFFKLGGDSLLTVRVLNSLQKNSRCDWPLKTCTRNPPRPASQKPLSRTNPKRETLKPSPSCA